MSLVYTVHRKQCKWMFLQWLLLLIYPVVTAIKNMDILIYLHVLIVIVQCINYLLNNYIYLKLL